MDLNSLLGNKAISTAGLGALGGLLGYYTGGQDWKSALGGATAGATLGYTLGDRILPQQMQQSYGINLRDAYKKNQEAERQQMMTIYLKQNKTPEEEEALQEYLFSHKQKPIDRHTLSQLEADAQYELMQHEIDKEYEDNDSLFGYIGQGLSKANLYAADTINDVRNFGRRVFLNREAKPLGEYDEGDSVDNYTVFDGNNKIKGEDAIKYELQQNDPTLSDKDLAKALEVRKIQIQEKPKDKTYNLRRYHHEFKKYSPNPEMDLFVRKGY